MTEVCYCYFDESYDYQTDDYETDYYNDEPIQEKEVFLTNANYPKKDWFCCNCYNLFETKSECLNHEKMCMKLL